VAVGLAIIAVCATGYFYVRSEAGKEKAEVDQALHGFLKSWASGEFDNAYSLVCPEQVGDFKFGHLSLTSGIAGYDGHREFSGSLSVPVRGPRTFDYDATTHFSDGTEGWVRGWSEKRDGNWCILSIEHSLRGELATPVIGPTPSPTEPSNGQSVHVEWFETDGDCNPRRPLAGSVSEVEFLALQIRATGFEVGEKVVVELFRNGSAVRSTTNPILVPPAGEATSLCLFGPVLSESAGGWPAGQYQVLFRLVGGAVVGNGNLRID